MLESIQLKGGEIVNILILDDHPLFASALSQIVLQLGGHISIDLAQDTQEAFKLIEYGKNFDLILLDLKLQGLDGFGFIRLLNNNFISSPIIVISASHNPENIQKALELGAVGFIHKSASKSVILDSIKRVMSGELVTPTDSNPVHSPHNGTALNTEQAPKEFGISQRQYSVLQQVTNGLSNKEIARELGICESTVKTHMSQLFNALAVHNRTACVTEAQRLGLL